jgi:hypothetical protein
MSVPLHPGRFTTRPNAFYSPTRIHQSHGRHSWRRTSAPRVWGGWRFIPRAISTIPATHTHLSIAQAPFMAPHNLHHACGVDLAFHSTGNLDDSSRPHAPLNRTGAIHGAAHLHHACGVDLGKGDLTMSREFQTPRPWGRAGSTRVTRPRSIFRPHARGVEHVVAEATDAVAVSDPTPVG